MKTGTQSEPQHSGSGSKQTINSKSSWLLRRLKVRIGYMRPFLKHINKTKEMIIMIKCNYILFGWSNKKVIYSVKIL